MGWNESYRFGAADLGASLTLLRCIWTFGETVGGETPSSASSTSLDPLRRLVCEGTYGGRLTTNWDSRCLRCLAENILKDNILQDPQALADKGMHTQNPKP